MAKHAASHEKQDEELKDMIKSAAQAAQRRYVINRKTRVAHWILAGYEDVGPEAITRCGLKYAYSKVTITSEPPSKFDECCDTCLPALRALPAL